MTSERRLGMTEKEFIANTERKLGRVENYTILAACEEWYGNGYANEVSGSVEAPTGHFYRVARWIVITDDQGFQEVFAFGSNEEAQAAFNTLDAEYGEWLVDNDDF